MKHESDRVQWPGRSFTKAVCYFQFFIGGLFFGLSPLVLPVSAAFDTDDSNLMGGVFFFGFAVMTVCYNVTAVYACFFSVHLSLKQRQRFVVSGLMAWPLGLAALAVSVQFKLLPLLLLVAFPLMGFAIGVEVAYLHLVEVAAWWGERVNIGHAFSGTASAVGACTWTLVGGELIEQLGTVSGVWILVATHAAATAVGLILVNPAAHLKAGEESESEKQSALSLGELALEWRTYVFTYVMVAFFFAGISMKTLLSVLFEELFDMSYIDSVRYSGACLALYIVARAVSPLISAGDKVFAVFLAVLLAETAAYALTPWAVKLPQYGKLMYTGFRLIGGAGFAILLSTTSVLLVRIFGSRNVPRLSGVFLALEWIPGLGPSLAFILHVEAVDSGLTRADSWNAFFYFNACIVATAAIGVCLLRCFQSSSPRSRAMSSQNLQVDSGVLKEGKEVRETSAKLQTASVIPKEEPHLDKEDADGFSL